VPWQQLAAAAWRVVMLLNDKRAEACWYLRRLAAVIDRQSVQTGRRDSGITLSNMKHLEMQPHAQLHDPVGHIQGIAHASLCSRKAATATGTIGSIRSSMALA
jgi:hypothetical protein